MEATADGNFAACLVHRLGSAAEFVDAATGEALAGARLADRIAGFAAGFRAAGLVPGDRVLIACRVSPASSLAYLGALYAGLTAVPVNERALAESAGALRARTGARAVWTERAAPADAADAPDGLALAGDFGPVDVRSLAPAPCRPADLAVLMPTSGSTGEPRLVKVTHGNLRSNTEAIVRSQRLAGDERAMLILPISYCFGASVLHSHLYQGGSVVFDARFMFPDKVLEAIGRYRCTTFAGVPTAYNILLRRSNLATIPLAPLRRFLQAGGALAPERIRRMRQSVPHAEFFVMYGQTEATARICCLPPERLEDKLGSVGLPLDNLQLRLVGDDGADAASGQTGEIWVRGPSVCDGYLEEPEETSRRFRDGWLATGDMAYRDKDGYLWIVGRRGEFVKMRGIRVGLAQIETRVADVPGVAECAAIRVEHVEAGEAVALYVVAEEGTPDPAAAIRRRLPVDWVVDSIHFVAELPKNLHGKLARSQLAGATGVAGGAP